MIQVGFRVQDVRFRVLSLELGVWCLGFELEVSYGSVLTRTKCLM